MYLLDAQYRQPRIRIPRPFFSSFSPTPCVVDTYRKSFSTERLLHYRAGISHAIHYIVVQDSIGAKLYYSLFALIYTVQVLNIIFFFHIKLLYTGVSRTHKGGQMTWTIFYSRVTWLTIIFVFFFLIKTQAGRVTRTLIVLHILLFRLKSLQI